jgi:hypothetical protein
MLSFRIFLTVIFMLIYRSKYVDIVNNRETSKDGRLWGLILALLKL